MPEGALRVLVVDDSAFIRKAVVRLLEASPELQVVGQAANGEEALALVGPSQAQVVTLDLVMPGMGGLATLEAFRRQGLPVVVLSGAVSEGAVALQALEMGAFDVVAKPAGGPQSLQAVGRDLIAKLLGAAQTAKPARPVRGPAPATPRPTVAAPPNPLLRPMGATGPLAAPPPPGPQPWRGPLPSVVLLGVSTGGPPALQRLVPALPVDLKAPLIVLQHMPPGYTRALAERLDRLSAIEVREAQEGDLPRPGQVLVAPSGRHLGFQASPEGPRIHLQDEIPLPSFYRPCIDHAFIQAAALHGARLLGVVLTGMGADGAQGVRAIRLAGGKAWAQDEASSAIYGMPRAATEAGVDEVVPLESLAKRLRQVLGHPVPIAASAQSPSGL